MIDKILETGIKETQKFLEFWTKFNELYKSAISQGENAKASIEMFITTRELVNTRFEELMDFLGVSRAERMSKCYPIYSILALDDFRAMSDDKISNMNDCWTESFIYLYGILNKMRRKKKRIEKFNGFFFLAKRLFIKGGKNDKKRNSP